MNPMTGWVCTTLTWEKKYLKSFLFQLSLFFLADYFKSQVFFVKWDLVNRQKIILLENNITMTDQRKFSMVSQVP